LPRNSSKPMKMCPCEAIRMSRMSKTNNLPFRTKRGISHSLGFKPRSDSSLRSERQRKKIFPKAIKPA
jgi:hypothetical protein